MVSNPIILRSHITNNFSSGTKLTSQETKNKN